VRENSFPTNVLEHVIVRRILGFQARTLEQSTTFFRLPRRGRRETAQNSILVAVVDIDGRPWAGNTSQLRRSKTSRNLIGMKSRQSGRDRREQDYH